MLSDKYCVFTICIRNYVRREAIPFHLGFPNEITKRIRVTALHCIDIIMFNPLIVDSANIQALPASSV